MFFKHFECWEGAALAFAVQRQHRLRILCLKDSELFTVLALNCKEGSTLSVLEVYANQVPREGTIFAGPRWPF